MTSHKSKPLPYVTRVHKGLNPLPLPAWRHLRTAVINVAERLSDVHGSWGDEATEHSVTGNCRIGHATDASADADRRTHQRTRNCQTGEQRKGARSVFTEHNRSLSAFRIDILVLPHNSLCGSFCALLTAKPWPCSVFLTQKQVFLPSYCQISTDLNKILHTPIVVRNTLVGRLRPRSAPGRLQAKPNYYVFVIFVTHPKSYIETTDRRDFGGKPSKWRWERVLSWKIPDLYSVGGARSKKNSIFSRFGVGAYPSTILCTAYRKQFYPNNSTDGVPFASMESLWPGIWQI